MQNEKTLLDLGFKHFKEWDSVNIERKNYRLDFKNKIFRAVVYGSPEGFKNDKTFVTLGICVNGNKVDRWRDFCSNDSVNKFINKNN